MHVKSLHFAHFYKFAANLNFVVISQCDYYCNYFTLFTNERILKIG